jgi:hypothetical protein
MSHEVVATETQSPELQRLEVILDEWSDERQAFKSTSWPAAKVTAVETFEWMPGELFFLHGLDDIDSFRDYADKRARKQGQ